MMGSGGLIVMDEDNCMVDIAKFFLEFTVDESCGKCTPCRIGTSVMLECSTRSPAARRTMDDLDKIEELCHTSRPTPSAALGQTAPNPVLSTMHYFHDEYVAHVVDKRCPAGVCKACSSYQIDKEQVPGCTLCARNCPVSASPAPSSSLMKIDAQKVHQVRHLHGRNCKFGAVVKK
jgi:hypothetical protein